MHYKGSVFVKILVLGATGRVGSQVVSHALSWNNHVTALVRSPEKLLFQDMNLSIVKGNAMDRDDILKVIKGIDVVVSALNTEGVSTLSQSIALVIDAMKTENIKRIITIGTAGILQSRNEPSLFRFQSAESKRKSTFAAMEHLEVFKALKQSGLDWTIVCPTYLFDGESLSKYRVERNYLPIDGSSISVLDTAEFTYEQVTCRNYLKTRVGIAY